MRASIIVPARGLLDLTQSFYKAVKAHSGAHELILIDNSKDNETEKWAKEKELYLIRNKPQKNIYESWNQGIRKAIGEYIFIVNNDILVTSGWVDKMIDIQKRSGAWCVVPKHTQGEFNEAEWQHEISNLTDDWTVSKLKGYCFMVPMKVFMRIGLFDEVFRLWYGDDDFYARLKKHHRPPVQANNVLIHHFHSRTLYTLGNIDKIVGQDKFYYQLKHEGEFATRMQKLCRQIGKKQ